MASMSMSMSAGCNGVMPIKRLRRLGPSIGAGPSPPPDVNLSTGAWVTPVGCAGESAAAAETEVITGEAESEPSVGVPLVADTAGEEVPAAEGSSAAGVLQLDSGLLLGLSWALIA